MKVYEDIESKVTVEFTKTHVGHGIDLGRMKITREEKEDIARKLENKIPVEAILDDIRNSMNQKTEKEFHFNNTARYKNIKEEYNISLDGILDSNDVVSVNKWIEGLKNRRFSYSSSRTVNIFDEIYILVCMAKIFLLVIMNSSQKDMLKFYGNDTICLDFTHGMNAYGFDLATLLVLDDKREGFPAAFILSNRQDSTALTLAFAAIKEHTCISPRVLMTEMILNLFIMHGR
ncbi:MULE domain-containing protein [Trichonephila inaurata madagascariensis]|uniref:MULE domain-containing protein n=1 Tax=Trichonephila inaurata madagascariensis TaxID=2747483 RepID=A0A8X6WXI7_9ARAC|nr:MULE domain-containing protein [Trichonephila inaurata madagascariensis]